MWALLLTPRDRRPMGGRCPECPRMDELAAVLRRERDLLDQLRFRFVETRLLLAAREIRYLRWATAEVDQARQRAQAADLMRAARVERLADRGAAAPPTLRQLANAS